MPREEPRKFGYGCTRCGREATEYEPMTPAGWLVLTTPVSNHGDYFAVLCEVCALALHDWLEGERDSDDSEWDPKPDTEVVVSK